MTEKEWLEGNQLSIDIYNKKYRNEKETFGQFLKRVSGGDVDVQNLIIDKKFIFGGRILANRGLKDRKVTYSNCFVISPPEDNLESIFDCASKMARTFSAGGGVGIDISKLRPNGSITHNAAKHSTGPVSFMDLYSMVTQIISQNGRRGATMISIDVRHPDVMEFIDCKTDLERVKFANISVRVVDDFMKAVENNEDYLLRWPCDINGDDEEIKSMDCPYDKLIQTSFGYVKRVKAKDVFDKLVRNNYDYAEPGILYWDNIESFNLVSNDDSCKYAGTNPCGEEPLMAGGSCLLGSLNLSEFVHNPFTPQACIEWEELERATSHAIVALNDVLDEGMERLPIEEQRKCVSEWRQIGLGTMGLHDMLLKLNMRYGSDAAIKLVDAVYQDIAKIAVLQSLELAKEKGAFSRCDPKLVVNSSFIKELHLPMNTLVEISKYGLRNSQILTCAPTGSIGTMLQTSTGVEPHFALKYTRRTQSLSGKDEFYDVDARIVEEYKKAKGDNVIPSYFVTYADIAPIDRIRMQEALQRNIDASISSTINLPNEATEEDVRQIYMEAWKHHLKGVTIYRSGCKREGILTTDKGKKNSPQASQSQSQRNGVMKRSKELLADFYTVKIKGEQFIVLVGMMDGRPYEVFAFKPNIGLIVPDHQGIITKKSKMHYMYKSEFLQINELELANESLEERAATLYASMLLRHNVPINQIIKIAKKVNGNIASFSSAMCRILSKYIPNDEKTGAKCPDCGAELVYEEGCIHCPSCGYSKCGN